MPRRTTANEIEVSNASQLRHEVSARNLARAAAHAHETTYGTVASVIYSAHEDGTHGNFYPGAYRRILAREDWSRRLGKAYTASSRVLRQHDRQRYELDCAISSDALLMNIFCAPGTCRSVALCHLLGVGRGLQPAFGVRASTPLRGGHDDRTEIDMQLGDLLVEAKFSEGSFGTARADLVDRYEAFLQVFDPQRLKRSRGQFCSYQLLRNILAAHDQGCRFALFCDSRRPDLQQAWFEVVSAVVLSDLRSRLLLITWQEIASCLSRPLQKFLQEKYGITGTACLCR